MTKLESFKQRNWIKHWAGEWSILTCTYLGYQYTKTLKETLGNSLTLSMFISKNGFSVCSLEKEDHHRFGSELAERIVNNENSAIEWSKELKDKTDLILGIIKKLENRQISTEDYKQFIKAFFEYGSPHRAVKIAVDFLPQEILDRLLPRLSEARLYAEPVYAETERLMRIFAQQLSDETGIAPELVLCMDKDEFENFLTSKAFSGVDVLQERYKNTAIFFENGEFELVTGNVVSEIEDEVAKRLSEAEVIKGTAVYPGKVKGTARVVFDPQNTEKFDDGDILVTGMTRPEYAGLITKSAAFVTDAGGMLSHAAITAREMKKPCIVGTEIASKVLKDGDLIEVDADEGVITIIGS